MHKASLPKIVGRKKTEVGPGVVSQPKRQSFGKKGPGRFHISVFLLSPRGFLVLHDVGAIPRSLDLWLSLVDEIFWFFSETANVMT